MDQSATQTPVHSLRYRGKCCEGEVKWFLLRESSIFDSPDPHLTFPPAPSLNYTDDYSLLKKHFQIKAA